VPTRIPAVMSGIDPVIRPASKLNGGGASDILRETLGGLPGRIHHTENYVAMKTVKVPNSQHPIAIERNSSRVLVTVAGRIVADTARALTLRESNYPPVQYVPREDVDMSVLERSDKRSHCPYKGDAAYYNITIAGSRGKNAVWTYDAPYQAVAEIKEHLAFYPDRVDAIDETT
jgi:uncharacterized protein (DUF427 family)